MTIVMAAINVSFYFLLFQGVVYLTATSMEHNKTGHKQFHSTQLAKNSA